jgi:glycosyltransferase involved in cell wall biosynthesis
MGRLLLCVRLTGWPALKECGLKVLVVGQTPPPITGQAVVIARILEAGLPEISLRHVPMRFSADVNEIGRFQLRKLVELARVVGLIAWERLRWRPDVLFYPPAGGSNAIPIARDLVILILTRWMFRCTVFHFHARGLGGAYDRAPALLRPLLRLAYFGADLAVRPAQGGGDDAARLGARHAVVIPNGVPDDAGIAARCTAAKITILYLSQVSEPKGILTLLDALSLVAAARPSAVVLNVVGPFASAAFRAEVEHRIRELNLQDAVILSGELSGAAKSQAYASADIFCFPSVHPTESFGLVAIEAMSFGLPVVAADWGGIRDIVQDGVTGLLFPPRDHARLAEALERLIDAPALRTAMGRRGRDRYVAEYTVERFRERLAAALRALSAAAAEEERRGCGRARGLAGQSTVQRTSIGEM